MILSVIIEVFHDKVLPQDPTIYLVNSNKSDPTQAPEGHENLKSITTYSVYSKPTVY